MPFCMNIQLRDIITFSVNNDFFVIAVVLKYKSKLRLDFELVTSSFILQENSQ